MQTEQIKDNSNVKRPRGRPRELTDDENFRVVSSEHYTGTKEEIEQQQRRQEIARARYYLRRYGNLNKFKPRIFLYP